jgi:acyl-CoA thioester hydrolase
MPDFYETTVRVRYAETDQMGVVYYANFYVWFEVGRVEMFRQMGFSYKEMEQKDDCFTVVGESQCRYKRPARYDDLLRIRTCVLEARKRTIRFGYEILNDSTGELVATGETLHIICGRDGRPKQLPERYCRLFGVSDPAPAQAGP